MCDEGGWLEKVAVEVFWGAPESQVRVVNFGEGLTKFARAAWRWLETSSLGAIVLDVEIGERTKFKL